MNGRGSWWLLPLGCLAMLTFVGVTTPPPATPQTTPPTPVPATADTDHVAIRDASARSRPIPFAALAGNSVLLDFGPDLANQRVHLRIHAHEPGHQDLDLKPTVRADGTLPIAGLPPCAHTVSWLQSDTLAAEHTFTPSPGLPRVELRSARH